MKDETIYLQHILTAIGWIESFLRGVDEPRFRQEKLLQNGVVREIEVIGEATKNLSDSLRLQYPHIPWRSVAGMRDKLIHAYFSVDLTEVWRTAQDDLPELKKEIEKILETLASPTGD